MSFFEFKKIYERIKSNTHLLLCKPLVSSVSVSVKRSSSREPLCSTRGVKVCTLSDAPLAMISPSHSDSKLWAGKITVSLDTFVKIDCGEKMAVMEQS